MRSRSRAQKMQLQLSPNKSLHIIAMIACEPRAYIFIKMIKTACYYCERQYKLLFGTVIISSREINVNKQKCLMLSKNLREFNSHRIKAKNPRYRKHLKQYLGSENIIDIF